MNYFIYTYIISLLTGRYELNKLTSLPMCGFIAQLVEHRTGIAEVTDSNPVEALIFFRLLFSSCPNWKIHCVDHFSLSSITAVQIYELFHIYLHQKRYQLLYPSTPQRYKANTQYRNSIEYSETCIKRTPLGPSLVSA